MVSPATKCEAYVALATMSYHRTGPSGPHGSPQNRCCRDHRRHDVAAPEVCQPLVGADRPHLVGCEADVVGDSTREAVDGEGQQPRPPVLRELPATSRAASRSPAARARARRRSGRWGCRPASTRGAVRRRTPRRQGRAGSCWGSCVGTAVDGELAGRVHLVVVGVEHLLCVGEVELPVVDRPPSDDHPGRPPVAPRAARPGSPGRHPGRGPAGSRGRGTSLPDRGHGSRWERRARPRRCRRGPRGP